MKTTKTIFTMLALCSLFFAGCSSDDDGGELKGTVLETDYFSVQNGKVYEGAVPFNASGRSIANEVNINSNAITGGSSYVSIHSEQQISEVYVGVEGVNFHSAVTPQTLSGTRAGQINTFIILFSQHLGASFRIQVSVRYSDGSMSNIYTTDIRTITAGTGSLQVSLSFDNDKDVDLYVVCPDGEVLYYNHQGNYEKDEAGNIVGGYGLDIDSNADCDIDGINNENVFFSSNLIKSGKYEVWVNMYENCNNSIATNWIITALYEGALVTPTYGQNPAHGVYPIGAPSNRIGSTLNDKALKVLEFTINRGNGTRALGRKLTPIPPTESAMRKIWNID